MTEQPHILVANIFFSPYSYGGATIVAEEVAKKLQSDQKLRVSAVSLIKQPDLMHYQTMKIDGDGIENYVINVPESRTYAEHYDNPNITQAFAEILDHLNPDLLHAHCLQEMGTGIFDVAKLKNIPIILSVHDYWWICERQFMIKPSREFCAQHPIKIENCRNCVSDFSRARLRFEKLTNDVSKADLVTYPSAYAKELCEASGMTSVKSTVWQNGVRLPTPEFFSLQAERRSRDRRTVFGFVGGPSQIKGWPLLKETFSALPRSNFKGLLVDGSLDGSWWRDKDISTMQGDWSIVPRFSQDEMDGFYSEIDVLLFLSQWKETFGLSIRECLARGIKVVQTDSGGTVEWDGANPSTMLAIGDGHEKLALKINEILDSSTRYTEPSGVTSFADQAAVLSNHISDVLAKNKIRSS